MEEGVEYVDGLGAVYLKCVGVGRMSWRTSVGGEHATGRCKKLLDNWVMARVRWIWTVQ
jgi:hypothetical protein